MSDTPKKRGRKSTKKPYFGPEQEEAVVKLLTLGSVFVDPSRLDEYGKPYLRWTGTTVDEVERGHLYSRFLKNPLDKMIESIIRTYGLYSKEMDFIDLHVDTLSFLMLKFHKFKPSEEKKSYSYYGTICKHYLLGRLIKEDRKFKNQVNYEDVSTELEENEELSYRIDVNPNELAELIQSLSKSVKKELNEKLLTENEIKVGNSLIYILDNWEDLLDRDSKGKKYHKNLILLYMRELTSLPTKDIRSAMKRYKSIYLLLKDSL